MALYDVIGKTYAQTRKSDPRITEKLREILLSSQVSTIADIGAGTGSYALALAENGYRIIAIEPSVMMRSQAILHPKIEWMNGSVDALPLANQSVDAAIIMLAFHHFEDHRQALSEIHRVVGSGQIVLFTYDPAMISNFWLTKYFPSFIGDVKSIFPSIPLLIDEIQSVTGNVSEVIPFSLPYDLSDSFAAVGWARPELYLNRNIRNSISAFTTIDDSELNMGLSRLGEDLERGKWDQRYGYLRQQSHYDVGYRFIHCSSI